MKKHFENIYQKICRELTIFENDTTNENTNECYVDVFYSLLSEVKNEIETLED